MGFRTSLKHLLNGRFSNVVFITNNGKIVMQSSILCLLWPEVGQLVVEQADMTEDVTVVIPDVKIEDIEKALGEIIEKCKLNTLGSILGNQRSPLKTERLYNHTETQNPDVVEPPPHVNLEDDMKDFIKGLPVKVIYEDIETPEEDSSLTEEYEDEDELFENVTRVDEVKDKKGSDMNKKDKESKEAEGQSVVCKQCEQTFKHADILKRHINAIHLGIRISCSECDFTTAYGKSRLNEHIYTKHNKSMLKHQCPTCGKKYVSKAHLREHEFTHNPKDIKCDMCEKTFFSLYYVKRHKKDVHKEQNIPCDVCCKMFKTKASVQDHYKTVHLSDSERKYKCDECGQGFHKLIAFRDHNNKHLGLTPYKCPSEECDQKYADNTRLHHHKKVCSFLTSNA